MGFRNYRITSRALWPAAILLIVFSFAAVYSAYRLLHERIEEKVEARLASAEDYFNERLSKDAAVLHAVADLLMRDPRMQQLWEQRDREALEEYCSPVFDDLREQHRITHFYFHQPDRINFLRVHCPSRRGDRIDRFTMLRCEQSGRTTEGIELGPLGTFTLRVVHPWTVDGRLLGYLELGEEIEHITAELNDFLDMQVIAVIDKRFLDRQGWTEGMKMLGRTGHWDAWEDAAAIDSTFSALTPEAVAALSDLSSTPKASIVSATFDGRQYRVGFVPFVDAGGRRVGRMLVLADVTDDLASVHRASIEIAVGCCIGGLMALVLAGMALRRLERRLELADEKTEAEARARQSEQRQNLEDLQQNRETLQEEHSRLQTITESAMDAIIMMDNGGAVSYWNNAATNMFGYREEEALGHSLHQLLAPSESRQLFSRQFPEFRASGTGSFVGRIVEVEACRSDGSRFPVEMSLSSVCLRGQWHAVAVLRDLTQRRENEQTMERILGAVEAATDALALTDAEGKPVYANPSCDSLFGRTLEEVTELGGPIALFADQEYAEQMFTAIRQGHSWAGETEIINPQRGRITISVRADAIRDKQGNIIGLLGVMSDITEQKANQKAIEQHAKALEEANRSLETLNEAAEAAARAKAEFLANMSHEIRTPMTAILGFAESLIDESTTPETRSNAVQIILRNGRFLLKLLDDVLDLSRLEVGRLGIQPVDCSPADILSDVAATMRCRAAEKQLEFSAEFVGRMPGRIQTDPIRLRQILVNLIGNAIKFTESGTIHVVSRVQRYEAGGQLRIEVHDTGIGIPKDQLDHVFEPFWQADESASRRFGGTGLGLSVSRRMAELLGGWISVASRTTGGTVFVLTVPTGPLEETDWLESSEQTLDSQTTATDAHTAEADELTGRVLLAEDGPDNRRLISLVLRRAGLEVEVAPDGLVACQMIEAAEDRGHPFDLILMDMQMPQVDGYEATRRLRARGFERPIVALTAHAMTGDRERCLAAGCDDYASKPIGRRDLLNLLRRHLPSAVSRPSTETT